MQSIPAPVFGDHNKRPVFPTAEVWLDHYEFCTANSHEPWPTLSYDELIIADAHGIFEFYQQWIPCVAQLRFWGLSPRFGREHEPQSEFEKETFLSSLKSDRQFASAVFNLIQGRG